MSEPRNPLLTTVSSRHLRTVLEYAEEKATDAESEDSAVQQERVLTACAGLRRQLD